jgi:hypothetical protein
VTKEAAELRQAHSLLQSLSCLLPVSAVVEPSGHLLQVPRTDMPAPQ